MKHTSSLTEVTVHHEPSGSTKRIWKVFWILLIITVIELSLGLLLYTLDLPEGLRMHLIKGVIIVLSLAKAYYIVSVFMHLGGEIRNMIMTIVVPLTLFIWFILAFIYDGSSYNNLRNKYDRYYKEQGIEKVKLSRETKPAKLGAKE
jgi:cytochrome c oxidase subunit IV